MCVCIDVMNACTWGVGGGGGGGGGGEEWVTTDGHYKQHWFKDTQLQYHNQKMPSAEVLNSCTKVHIHT